MAKLFEQGGDVTPELDKRVAWGKVGEPTQNSSWAKILTWLESVLGFLRKDANLSDLTNKDHAQHYLDVYSKAQVDNRLADRALKSDVLTKNNTTPYTPTSSYHPATRKMVLDLLRGDPYVGASSIIDSNWETAGEVENIYGIVQQSGLVVTVNIEFKGRLPDTSNTNGHMFVLPNNFGSPLYIIPIGISTTGANGSGTAELAGRVIRCTFRATADKPIYSINFSYVAQNYYV